MGIKIYTIGVGKEGRVPYPVDDVLFGRRYQYVETNLTSRSSWRSRPPRGTLLPRAEHRDSGQHLPGNRQARAQQDREHRADRLPRAGTLFLLPAALCLLAESSWGISC